MRTIMIEGAPYPVLGDLGYVHDIGHRAKQVQTQVGERVAVWRGGSWRFWTDINRTAPLRVAAERAAREARDKEIEDAYRRGRKDGLNIALGAIKGTLTAAASPEGQAEYEQAPTTKYAPLNPV